MYTIYEIERTYNEARSYDDIVKAVSMVWDNNIGYTVEEFRNDIFAIFPEEDENIVFAVEDILDLALLHYGYAKKDTGIVSEDEKVIIESYKKINY